jgi:RNA polymerase sigma-70 factor (ECF subfamily)
MVEAAPDPIAVARAAWPEIHVPDELFLDYIAARRAGVTAEAHLPAADLYLACACVQGVPAALAAFEKRCLAGLVEALVRQDLPRVVAEDAVQNVRQKLLVPPPGTPGRIGDYKGAGSLAGWVKVIAIRETLQLLRKERPPVADDQLVELPLDTSDPELAHFRKVYLEQFREALLAALAELPRRDRNVLRHQYVYRMTIDQIGAIYHVHRVTASRWEAKARTALLAGTRRRLMQRLKVSAAELESIMRIIQSQLDISLLRYLGNDE